MSSVRVPRSLRGSFRAPSEPSSVRKDVSKLGLFTAACVAASSPASIALAQEGGSATTLPALNVEAKVAKKKALAAPAKKSSGTPIAKPAAAPTPPVAQVKTPDQKSADPYADPQAPYKVDSSASTKVTEPLLNTPKTVTAIPKEVIQDKAATSIRELARTTPGVTLGFAEGGNAFGDRIYIRGFDARGDIYADGIRDPGNASRETFAVDQVEIFKGPAATIAGRGTTGGAVNIVTKKPTDENFFDVSTMFGTDRTVRITLDVNEVLNPGLAVRANVLYHTNDVSEREYTNDERWGGLLSAEFKPTDSFKLFLDYYRLRTNGTPDWGVPFDPRSKLPVTETAGVSRDTWYGNNNRDYMKNDADVYTATAEFKLDDNVKLTSKFRTGRTIVSYLASSTEETSINNATPPSSWTATVHNPNRYQTADIIINQTDLTSKIYDPFGFRHTLVTGFELNRENVTQQSISPTLANIPKNLFDPDPNLGAYPVGFTAPINRSLTTQAIYALDTVQLDRHWIVNAGVRLDNYDRADTGPFNANPNNNPNGSAHDVLFNWNAGIVYKPVEIGSIYLAYATSSNPVGQELDATGVDYGGLAVALAQLPPEENQAWELGTKWELFDRHLLATAALFQTDKENAREAGLVGVNPPPTATGAYRVRGIELGSQGNLTKEWSVYGGIVLMQTDVLQSSNPAFVGRPLANIPLYQFNLLSKYKLTDKLEVGGSVTYSSEVLAGVLAENDTGFHIPEHWRFDALAEYEFNEHLELLLQGINLTNELYYDALYRSATPFAFVAPGRAAYATIIWKY
jgi:catecholate siderophore receptor